jgi:hypothetical protein
MQPTTVLELVDAGIQGFDARGELFNPSPGIAVVEGSDISVGRAAAAKARLLPRRVHRRFWQQMDTEPLGRPFPGRLRAADLVHAHLESVWSESPRRGEAVLLAVPWIWDERQLGLLLGIARSCGIRVAAVIDLAAASAAAAPGAQRCFHLDLHLHRTVLTELERGAEIVRVRTEIEPHVGLAGLHDRWLRRVASAFVRATRFDPLHRAATEQVLADRLPLVLEEVTAGPSSRLSMTSGGRVHTVTVDRQDVVAAALEAYGRLKSWVDHRVEGGGATLLLSHRAAALPGMVEHLAEISGLEVRPLPRSAAAHAALKLTDLATTDDGRTPVVTRFTDRRAPESAGSRESPGLSPPPKISSGPPPSHLVIGGIAHRIVGDEIVLGSAPVIEPRYLRLDAAADGVEDRHCRLRIDDRRVVVEDLSRSGTAVNGRRIQYPTPLHAGDRLRLGTPGLVIPLVALAE